MALQLILISFVKFVIIIDGISSSGLTSVVLCLLISPGLTLIVKDCAHS